MSKLIFGCGYLGSRVAERWLAAGETVFAVTRSADRAQRLEQHGLRPIVADVVRPASLKEFQSLHGVNTVLYAVGYDRSSGASMHQVYVDGLKAALDALRADVGRIVYISSTGVYGQTGGDWVDEYSECLPEREGGRACLAAEQVLAAHPLGPRAMILRLAGIYGPGRIPRKAELLAAQPIAAAEHGFLNLIHVEDAAGAVLAAAVGPSPPKTYVVSDGCPVERREYFAELARLLKAPAPHFVPPPAGSPAAGRAASDKRVCSERAFRELGLALRYPSYRQGLAAIVAAEQERA